MESINPALVLDEADRAQLVAIMRMPGWVVLHKLMRSEVDKFILAHVNIDVANDAGVLASHKVIKAAAQFYEGITRRTNAELESLGGTQPTEPVDATEGILDLGEFAKELEDVPNLLGGELE